MASLVTETQLEKDVASKAGVIPIWPWLDGDGKTKDGLPPNIYANMLLEAKRQNGEEGIIRRCDHDKCEPVQGIGTKSMYWRSVDTDESIVPKGWTDFGGLHHFTYCPNCRARDIQDIGLDEDREDGRVDINLKHGSTGSTGASDKPLRPLTVSLPRPKNTKRRTNMKLKAEARELWKNHPEQLSLVLQEIDNNERKKRANAAENRKRKRTGGKKRRKKRRKTRRKKRRKSRRKKRHQKKRTRRRRR